VLWEQELLTFDRMKIAIISDIHGNLEALEAVLRDIAREGCAKTYCLGDVVGYGPSPNEACARVRELGIETVQDNHDEAAALDFPLQEALMNPVAYKSLLWTRKVLLPEHRRWLRELPHCIDVPELNASLSHASPQNPEAWEYITSRYQAWDVLESQTQTVCFIGHTHRPFVSVLRAGVLVEERPEVIAIDPICRYLINVGSVGQPRNLDPRCSYVIFDGDAQTVTFRQVDYPILITQLQIREQNLPDRLAERLAVGV
jgi:diadenosine tetraphosphatase ApaH/serine/threonine PP2A family protein phosphatase